MNILVWIEQFENTPSSLSWEVLGKARQLADTMSARVMAAVLGSGVEDIAKEAFRLASHKLPIATRVITKDTIGETA